MSHAHSAMLATIHVLSCLCRCSVTVANMGVSLSPYWVRARTLSRACMQPNSFFLQNEWVSERERNKGNERSGSLPSAKLLIIYIIGFAIPQPIKQKFNPVRGKIFICTSGPNNLWSLNRLANTLNAWNSSLSSNGAEWHTYKLAANEKSVLQEYGAQWMTFLFMGNERKIRVEENCIVKDWCYLLCLKHVFCSIIYLWSQ